MLGALFALNINSINQVFRRNYVFVAVLINAVQLICINIDGETQSGSSTHFILYKNKKLMISKTQRYMASVAAAIAVNFLG